MSTVTSSDNSEVITSLIQNVFDSQEESGSDDTVGTAVSTVTETVYIPDEKKQIFEKYASSSNISPDSSSSNSDTDNSSDLDEEEIKKDKAKCYKRVHEIESEFDILKEMLYKEKMDEIENEFKVVGMSATEDKVFKNLENQMKSQLNVASELRKFKIAALKHKHEAEEQAIRQSFENNKDILYDTIKTELEEKIQQLDEARNDIDIDAALWLGRSLTRSGRGRGRRPYGHVQPKCKPVMISAVNGPGVVYMLKEDSILEDWSRIKKMLSSTI